MKFKYIGRCAKGFVEFVTKDGNIVMETGVAVGVPDSLAAKLANNDHFERVLEDGEETQPESTPKRRGRRPKAQPEAPEAQ